MATGPQKINGIPPAAITLTRLIVHANPSTGLGGWSTVEDLIALLTASSNPARGDWAGTTTLPDEGNNGTLADGVPAAGNRWRLTATLAIGGNVYAPGTVIEAAIDTPGQTLTNWIFYAVQL